MACYEVKFYFYYFLPLSFTTCPTGPAGWISIKFDTGDFHENMSMKSKFSKKRLNIGHFI
jgi:hypothetical protein